MSMVEHSIIDILFHDYRSMEFININVSYFMDIDLVFATVCIIIYM